MQDQRLFDQLLIGQTAEFSKTLGESDVYLFAGITGDFNPIHINQEHAEKSYFGSRLVHGMLTASLLSTVLGTKLPGPNSIYRRQEIEFKAPVYIGDTVTAKVEIVDKREKGKIIILKTVVINQKNITVVEGKAEIKFMT